jgi:hypothetical protein
MPEITFSKKQLAPLITKFGIDVEKNTLFHRVINLFNGQSNYHVWAVKAVFSGEIDIESLETIKEWATNNPKQIQQLSKNGNIVSYTSKSDFKTLFKEIDGITKKAIVNDAISLFNTDQRNMLKTATNVDNISNIDATGAGVFKEWFKLLSAFTHLHRKKKDKVVRSLSAVRNIDELKKLIGEALKESYVWDKEDMLNFVQNNCPNVHITYDMGPIVILEIPTYQDSNKICYGRTTWCITRSSDYFRQYVTDKKGNRQFFFFDFSKKETHELAHVGFTVSPKGGITNAHSTNNVSMIGTGVSVDNSYWNIQRLLTTNNISMGMFMNLRKLTAFKWEMDSIVDFIASTNGCDIVFQRDNILIAKVTNNDTLNKMIGFSFIPTTNYTLNNDTNAFVLFNLDMAIDSNESVIFMLYKKDIYGTFSPQIMYSTYGSNCADDKPLAKLGIVTTDFIECGPIDPNILLHKYIDENSEDAAIKLIDEGVVDVNYKFNNRIPVYAAIDNKMFNLFTKIVLDKNFNGSMDNGFGENMLQVILWSCYLDPSTEVSKIEKNDKEIRSLVIDMLESGKFGVNDPDINDDTLMHIAAMDKNMSWLLDYLVRRPDVNPNLKNDINFSPLATALHENNMEGAKIIGMRPDLVVDEIDNEIAKSNGINLKDIVKPVSFEEMGASTVKQTSDGEASYHEVLSKIFANR